MRKNLLFAVAVTVTALLAGGCDSHEESSAEEKAEKNHASAPVKDPNRVSLKPEMLQRIQTGLPSLMEIADSLRVPSRIEVNEQKVARIGASVTGRIVEVYAMLGDTVKPGSILARISSPELTQTQLAYLRAHSQTILAQRAMERAHQLLAGDVIGSAELQRRESELQVFQAELSAAADQLRMLGISSSELAELSKRGQILPSVAITAAHGGVVIDRKVVAGQVVQPSDLLFTVADLSSVWVVGSVPEQSVEHVLVDHDADVYIPALGNMKFDGRIVFVADTVDPLTRTVMVRTLVDNAQRKLKPAMLARMSITDDTPHQHMVIPESAVVRENDRDHVFLVENDRDFLLVPVELGATVDQIRVVLKGLNADQKIVLDGAFHLNNERKRAELE